MNWKRNLALCASMLVLVACGPSDEDNNKANNNHANHENHNTNNTTANNTTANNTSANNTSANNTSANNTSANNTSANNTSANNTSNADVLMQWETCRADTTEYERFEETISSIARIGAFEDIADLLWENEMEIMDQDFIDSNLIYVEEEGLDSRVSRREDEHYMPVMEGGMTLSCRDDGVPEKDPNRCVGPAQIRPLVLDAFTEGAMGEGEHKVEAAKVEAALLWFLYVSSYKEATTCAAKAKDCDSSFAYYGGGEQQDGGLGLARYFKTHAPAAHDEVWDGLIAVRCWRGIDDGEEATNTELHDMALAELDEGLDYGLARLVVWRLDEFDANEGVDRDADWAFLKILGPALQRAADARDANAAASLETAWAGTADELDVAATKSTIETLFPAP